MFIARKIFKKLVRKEGGVELEDKQISNVRSAKDIVVFSESTNELQQLLND